MKPIVMVWIDGGIGYTEVVRGEVDVLFWDWDNITEGDDPAEIRAYIANAQRLPDDYVGKAAILASMIEYLTTLEEDMNDD